MEYTEPYFEDDFGFESDNQTENNFQDNKEQLDIEEFKQNNQFEELEEKPKKRKPSKGKRFK